MTEFEILLIVVGVLFAGLAYLLFAVFRLQELERIEMDSIIEENKTHAKKEAKK